jgi:hypothetical protein
VGLQALELFAGSGRLAAALRAQGVDVDKYELADGPASDLSRHSVQRSILRRIRDGKLRLVWMGVPCSSFSRARRGVLPTLRTKGSRMPTLLRTSEEPWGVKGLKDSDMIKVTTANILVKFCVRVAHACLRVGVGFVIENPRSSILWWTDAVQQLENRRGVERFHLDFCRYGTAWRKSTSLLTNLEFVEDLALRCKGRRGVCGVTHLPHHRLSGRDESGSWWTKRAEPYPKKLVRSFAQLFVNHEASEESAT